MKYFSITDEIIKYRIYMCKDCIFYVNKKCEKKLNAIECAKLNLKSK